MAVCVLCLWSPLWYRMASTIAVPLVLKDTKTALRVVGTRVATVASHSRLSLSSGSQLCWLFFCSSMIAKN